MLWLSNIFKVSKLGEESLKKETTRRVLGVHGSRGGDSTAGLR